MGSTSSNESNESHVQPATSSNAKLISPPDMKHLRVPRAAHSTAANALHKAICQSSARRKRVEHGGKFIDDFQISTFPPPFVKLPEGDAWKSCTGTIMYPLPTADMRKDFEQVYQLFQKEKSQNAKCVAMYPSKSGQTEIGPSNTEVPAMDMPYTTRRPQVPVTERMPTITQHKHKASFERIKGLPVLKQRSPRSLLARSATKAKQLLLKRKHRKNAATQSIVVPCVVLKNSERRGGHPLYQLQSAVQKVENVRQYSAAQLERFLHKLEYDRLECYERKTSTLRDYGDTTRAMHHMRQAAENMRQSDVETCYEKSSWYNGLLSIISAGGKDITKEELFVAHYIKLVLDRGHIFCKQMLMALIKCFSNEEIGAIQLQEVFRFLRNEAIPEDDTLSLKQWDAFFAINKLPEPIEVLEEKKRLEVSFQYSYFQSIIICTENGAELCAKAAKCDQEKYACFEQHKIKVLPICCQSFLVSVRLKGCR